MEKIKIKDLLAILVIAISLTSCLKKADMNIDTENLTPTVMELQFLQKDGTTINSGMQYFSGGALTYPSSDIADTATYNISLAGPVTLGSDLNVTVAVDATKLMDNYKSDSIKYELMPDSLYHFIATTAVVKAGERIAHMKLIFYPSKADVSKSYMLPVIIKDASGKIISSNFSTVYFHMIGNPIAGSYTNEWIRYNSFAITGTAAYDETSSAIFNPVNPTSISVESPTGIVYVLSFVNKNGVLSDFKVKMDATSVADAGITITGGPTIVLADPIGRKYEFNFTYNNSAGSARNITDKFY